VDLEQREVIDLLPDRSAGGTADWLMRHPEIELISRDRCGSFAQGGREGAPQARQIADRFFVAFSAARKASRSFLLRTKPLMTSWESQKLSRSNSDGFWV
jgi:transposase